MTQVSRHRTGLTAILARQRGHVLGSTATGAAVGLVIGVILFWLLRPSHNKALLFYLFWIGCIGVGAVLGTVVGIFLRLWAVAVIKRWYSGLPPLLRAAFDGDQEQVQQLVKGGSDVNQQDGTDGPTSLLLAVYEGWTEVADFLIKQGAAVNVTGTLTPDVRTLYKGCTPLHAAVLSVQDTVPIISLLSSRGANLNARDLEGLTPLHYSVGALVFQESEAGVYDAAKRYARAETLLKLGADVNATTPEGRTPLHIACNNAGMIDKLPALVNLLLEHGADHRVTISGGALQGRTAFHLASHNKEIVDILAAHDADTKDQKSRMKSGD